MSTTRDPATDRPLPRATPALHLRWPSSCRARMSAMRPALSGRRSASEMTSGQSAVSRYRRTTAGARCGTCTTNCWTRWFTRDSASRKGMPSLPCMRGCSTMLRRFSR